MRRILLFLVPLLFFAHLTSAFERRTPVVEAVAKAGPAVVNIRTEQIVRATRSWQFGFGESLFDEFYRYFGPQPTYTTQSLGSGVIVDARGYILTNTHVIAQASKIFVALPEGKTELAATLIGSAPEVDLALLKVEGENFPTVPLRQEGELYPGETVIAIGNPLGLGHSVTTGVVSAPRRRLALDAGEVGVFIQTDALINPGNSGGPLLDINGELIGINTAIARQAQGIGFSTPASVAQRIVRELMTHGRIRPAYVGLLPANVAQVMTRSRGSGGVLVTEVEKDSPAELAGIALADVILAMDGIAVESPHEYLQLMRSYPPGSRLKVQLLRGAEEFETTLKIARIPEGYLNDYCRRMFGFTVRSDGGSLLIDEIVPRSGAAEVGLFKGDRVLEVAGIKVATLKTFEAALAPLLGEIPVTFLVARGNHGYYIELPQ